MKKIVIPRQERPKCGDTIEVDGWSFRCGIYLDMHYLHRHEDIQTFTSDDGRHGVKIMKWEDSA